MQGTLELDFLSLEVADGKVAGLGGEEDVGIQSVWVADVINGGALGKEKAWNIENYNGSVPDFSKICEGYAKTTWWQIPCLCGMHEEISIQGCTEKTWSYAFL